MLSARCFLAPWEANPMNRAATRTQWNFLLHPQQRGLLSFISERVIVQINICDGLVGFKGGGKSLSVPKTAAGETYTDRRISPSYQPQSIFGLLKASCISYFHAHLLRAPNSSRLQVWNFHGATEIIPLDLDALDGPPKLPRLRPPGLDSRVANLVESEEKRCNGFVDAQRIGQDLEKNGKQSVKRITRGKNITQKYPRRHFGDTIRVVNLTKLLTHSAGGD